jgi:hypothetical protein
MISRNRRASLRVVERTAEQRLGIAADRRQRGAQLVRDVGDEVAPNALEPLHVADVVKDENEVARPARGDGHRRRRHLQDQRGAPAEVQIAHERPLHDAGVHHFAHQLVQIGMTRQLDEWLAEGQVRARQIEQHLGAAVHQQHRAGRVDDQHALDHAAEHLFELALLGTHCVEPLTLRRGGPHQLSLQDAERAAEGRW